MSPLDSTCDPVDFLLNLRIQLDYIFEVLELVDELFLPPTGASLTCCTPITPVGYARIFLLTDDAIIVIIPSNNTPVMSNDLCLELLFNIGHLLTE